MTIQCELCKTEDIDLTWICYKCDRGLCQACHTVVKLIRSDVGMRCFFCKPVESKTLTNTLGLSPQDMVKAFSIATVAPLALTALNRLDPFKNIGKKKRPPVVKLD